MNVNRRYIPLIKVRRTAPASAVAPAPLVRGASHWQHLDTARPTAGTAPGGRR